MHDGSVSMCLSGYETDTDAKSAAKRLAGPITALYFVGRKQPEQQAQLVMSRRAEWTPCPISE